MTSLLHAVPKPTPRPKRARKPIQRKARLQAKSLGVSRRPSKTKHARRPRASPNAGLVAHTGQSSRRGPST